MFEDQSSVDEKIYSMEVGEKEECWEEERERENSVRLPSAINPDARRPTPDARRPTPNPSVNLKPLCRQVAVSAKSRRSVQLESGRVSKSWSQPFMTIRTCTATQRRQ